MLLFLYIIYIFIHVPLFYKKIILNCKYNNLDFLTMHAIKNKKIKIRGNPVGQTIINKNLIMHKKHTFIGI